MHNYEVHCKVNVNRRSQTDQNMTYNYRYLDTQNSVLSNNLMEFYRDEDHVAKLTQIIEGDRSTKGRRSLSAERDSAAIAPFGSASEACNLAAPVAFGDSGLLRGYRGTEAGDGSNNTPKISLRIIDWFVTNYAKKYFVVYDIDDVAMSSATTYDASRRFKVFNDYKLKLKAYSKKRFDPFCRWTRIRLPNMASETTLGQLNFFKWAIENRVLEYIEAHYEDIEHDMNTRNSNSKRRRSPTSTAELDLDAEAEGDVDDDNDMDDGDDEDDTTADAATNVSNDPATHLSKPPVSLKSPNSNMNTTLKDPKVRTTNEKTRKRREELSVSACKCMKTEIVQVLVKFNY